MPAFTWSSGMIGSPAAWALAAGHSTARRVTIRLRLRMIGNLPFRTGLIPVQPLPDGIVGHAVPAPHGAEIALRQLGHQLVVGRAFDLPALRLRDSGQA